MGNVRGGEDGDHRVEKQRKTGEAAAMAPERPAVWTMVSGSSGCALASAAARRPQAHRLPAGEHAPGSAAWSCACWLCAGAGPPPRSRLFYKPAARPACLRHLDLSTVCLAAAAPAGTLTPPHARPHSRCPAVCSACAPDLQEPSSPSSRHHRFISVICRRLRTSSTLAPPLQLSSLAPQQTPTYRPLHTHAHTSPP